MPGRIDNVEIFAVGTWRGSKTVTVTSADLDAMIESFNSLNATVEGFRPPVKLGHTEQQKFWGGKSGAPALGFVEKIWRVGDKVLANFSDVPDALIDMVKRRLYNTVSIEMYSAIEHAGKKFKNVLSAVAFLGAELPAVKGLQELSASLFESAAPELKLEFSEKIEMFTQEQVDSLIKAAVEKAKAEFEAARAAELKKLQDEVADSKAKFEASEKAKATVEAALATFKTDAEAKEIESMVQKAIDEGKVLPKQKDEVIAMASAMRGQKVKFGAEEKSGVDVFKAYLDGLPKAVEFGERGAANGKDQNKMAGDKVSKMATERAAKDKIEYASAVQLVLAENPELKAQYFAEV
jgi:hypothetical protein